ncbi:MAG: DUF177 domain-containing protein [Bacillota bacterium]
MKVDISGLKAGVGLSSEHAFHLPFIKGDGWEDAGFSGPVDIQVRLLNTGEGIVAGFHVRAGCELPCSRCTRDTGVSLDMEFSEEYRQEGTVGDEDSPYLTYDGDVIDLTEAVRQNLLLNLPMKVLCREDCAGLCPQCGADLAQGPCSCGQAGEDERWETLKQLKGTEEGGRDRGRS